MPGREISTPTFRGISRVAGLGLAIVLLAACAGSRQYFVPLERVHGQTAHGYAQSFYPLQGPSGVFGEATLWSRGAYPTHDGSTVIHVALRAHNTSGAPISIDPADLRVGEARTRGGTLRDLRAAERVPVTVAPQATAEITVHFVMPPDVSPTEIDAFTLVWAVHGPQSVYYQRTAFAERRDDAGYYYGPYDRYPCWPYGPYDCVWGAPPGPYPYPVVIHEREPERGGRVTVERRR